MYTPYIQQSKPVRGVISTVTDQFLIVTIDDFDDSWWETEKLILQKVPDEITHKRLLDTMDDLKSYLSSDTEIAQKIVDVAFYNAEPNVSIYYYVFIKNTRILTCIVCLLPATGRRYHC